MTITVDWDTDDPTIVLYEFSQHWTLEEFYLAMEATARLLAKSTQPLSGFIIRDTSTIQPPPSSMSAFRKALTTGKPPMVFVSANKLAQVMIKSIVQTYPNVRPVYFADSLEDARQQIHTHNQQEQT